MVMMLPQNWKIEFVRIMMLFAGKAENTVNYLGTSYSVPSDEVFNSS